nr:hypothetical protein [Tanacetum cinerariifolium]
PEPLESIVLWNPSIKKSVRIGIPKLPRICTSLSSGWFTMLATVKVCNVWMMKDDHVTNSFNKMLSVKSSNWLFKDLLEFGKNGDAIIETIKDDDHFVLQVYDPLGRISVLLPDHSLTMIMMATLQGPEPLESIVLWNPSIRKSVSIDDEDDHVTKSFTKMLSIKSSDRLFKDVLEFRKNGDAIIETIEDDDHFVLHVYDPCLGRIILLPDHSLTMIMMATLQGPEPLESIVLWNPSIRNSFRPKPLESIVLWNPSIRKSVSIGIPKLPRTHQWIGDVGMEGSYFSFSIRSYKEMLLLLDE